MCYYSLFFFFFFFNDTATTEIYTLSLHDALPIYADSIVGAPPCRACRHWPHSTESIAKSGRSQAAAPGDIRHESRGHPPQPPASLRPSVRPAGGRQPGQIGRASCRERV